MFVAVIVQNARMKYGFAGVFPQAPARIVLMTVTTRNRPPKMAARKFVAANT